MFLACGTTVLAFTYLLYSLLGNAAHPVLRLPAKPGKAAPDSVARQAKATIHMPGLGQLALDRPQLLVASGIALVVIAAAATAIGWLIAGRVLRPLRTITAAARRISASSLHERLALYGPDDEPRNWPTLSTTCSRGWRRPSRPSGASPPTPHTSCARR